MHRFWLAIFPLKLAAICAFALPLGFAPSAIAEVTAGDISAMHEFAQSRLERARTGTIGSWTNPGTGARGFLKIVSTDNQPGRPPCREYEWSIVAADGEMMEGRGQGCRISGGQWSLDETQAKQPPRKPEAAEEKAAEAPPVEKSKAAPEEEPSAEPKPNPIEELAFTVPPRTLFVRRAEEAEQ